jgi:formate/nitrite transporter
MQQFECYRPAEIAKLVEQAGVGKTRLGADRVFMLALLAGAFIGLGAMIYTLVVTGSELGFGPTRLLGGIAFSLGLILVIIGGAELFTGNNLIVMAWADRQVTTGQLLKNWGVVYCGNFIGAVSTALLVAYSGVLELSGGAVGETAATIASGKLALDPMQALLRGVLCNVLVCLAVWLSFAARRVSGKILAIVFPVSAFVGAGFEHSVANMYAIPLAMFTGDIAADWGGFAGNLVFVTVGNVIGGGLLVALVYWAVYLRASE